MPNPVNYSDLLKPDSTFDDAIKKVGELDDKFETSLNKIKEIAAGLVAQLKALSGATGETPKKLPPLINETARLAKAQKELQFAYTENAKELAKMKQQQKEQNEVTKLTIKFNQSAEGSYNKLSAEYALIKIRLNKMSDAERSATTEGKKLEKQARLIYEEMNRLQKATGKSQLQVGRYQLAAQNATQAMTMMPGPIGMVTSSVTMLGNAMKAMIKDPVTLTIVAITAAVVGAAAAFKSFVSTAAGFEKQMDKVEAITGASASEMSILSQNAKDLGASTTKTASEVGQLQEEYAKLGFTTGEILNATEATIALSEAAGSDLATSASVAGATIRGFGLDASESQRVVDVMAKSFTRSALDMTKFQTSMAQVAPVAKAANVSLEQSTAFLGTLSDAGLDASTSGTSLRNIFLILEKKGLTFAQAMNMINGATDKAKTSMDLFGKRGAVAGLVLAENGDRTAALAKELENADGAAAKMAATMRDNLEGDMAGARSAMEGFSLAVEDGSGVFTQLSRWAVQSFTKIVRSLTQFVKDFKVQWNELVKGSAGFRISLAMIENVFKAVFGTIGDVIKSVAEEFVGLGKIIKGVFTMSGEDIVDGFKQVGNAGKNLLISLKDRAIDAGKNIKEAFTGESVERYTINVKDATVAVEDETKAVKRLTQEQKNQFAQMELTEKERKKLEKERKKRLKEQQEAEKKAAREKKEREKALLDAMDEGREKDILKTLMQYEEKKKVFEKYGMDVKSLDEWRQRELDKIEDKYDKKAKEKTDARLKKEYDAAKKSIDEQYQLQLSEIDLMEKTEEEKTRLRLEAERNRLQKMLALETSNGKKLSAEQIKTVKNQIKAIDGEITKSKKGAKDIYDIFGLKLSDDMKQGINDSVSFAMDQLNSYMDLRVQMAEAAVQATQEEVDTAKSRLDAEIAARNSGYANNVTMAQKELDLAKKNQEKALKEQRKAQKAQEAVQTVQQTYNLITASTLIWSQVGVPWLAIPLIALMWASFAATKVKAAQATKSESYGDGTVEYLHGGSHQSGSDIDLGTKSDGTKRRAEGGELFAVINKRSTRQYGQREIKDVFNSINQGTFYSKYRHAYDSDGYGMNVSFGGTDVSGLERDVRDIKKQNERRIISTPNGMIEYYKNVKRTYRM